MMNKDIRDIRNQLRTSSDKYTYFLLTIAASAIVFSLQVTNSKIFSSTMIPLAIAVTCWGISFYFGCMQIKYVNSTLYANHAYLKVIINQHEDYNLINEEIKVVSEAIMMAIKDNSKKATFYSNWQFKLAIFGALFFILWHLIEMGIRTTNFNLA